MINISMKIEDLLALTESRDEKVRTFLASDYISVYIQNVELKVPKKGSFDVHHEIMDQFLKDNYKEKLGQVREYFHDEQNVQEQIIKQKQDEIEKLFAAFLALVNAKLTLTAEELNNRWAEFVKRHT